MRFVTGEKEIHAEWWADGETVTIKQFSHYDREQVRAAYVHVGDPDEFGDRKVTVDRGEFDLALLEHGIVKWTVKGENGKPLPLTREWLEKLSDEDAGFILDEINAYNPRRDAEAQESFRGGSGAGAEER